MRRVVLDGLPLAVRSAGVATYTRELAIALAHAAAETEFALFCPRFPGRGRVVPPPGAGANLVIRESLRYPLVMGSAVPLWPRCASLEAAAGSCDLFHGTTFALPRRHTAPAVVTVHDLALLRFPALGTAALRRMVERGRAAARRARAVIAVSAATRRDVVELCGVAPERVHVVPNGVGAHFTPLPESAARAAAAARIGDDAPFALHVGTLEPRKNLPRLLRAFADLGAAAPRRLVLAGGRAWGAAAVEDCIAELGLGERVALLGDVPTSALPALYAAAEFFVYPSLYEGFGLPVLEAMACGAAVITSNTSALPEVAGDAALTVDPEDTGALRDAMRRLVSDTELRAELRRRGALHAAHFSWQRAARETLAVYRSALA